MNSLVLFFIILFVFFVFLLCGYLVYFRFEQPYCGGKLDSSSLLCDNQKEQSCNPKDSVIYYKDIGKSLQYIFRLYNKQKFIVSPSAEGEYEISKGVFFFGIPDILRALPTDFGQNSLSPYGFISFLPLYPACISNKSDFCSQLFTASKSSLVSSAAQLECVSFLNGLSSQNPECKFPVNDSSPDVYIDNNVFFNEIGMLGAFSIYENQCVLLRFKIPQSKLGLMYWSFNFYIADSLGKNNICSPTYQAIVGSLTHSLNLFHVAAQSRKRKNPFKDDFDIIIIVSYNEKVTENAQKLISSNRDLDDIDMVHEFRVPTTKGSLTLTKELPNPNLYNKDSRLFNPETDRLAVLLRLTPRKNDNDQQLENYIYQVSRNDFSVNLIEFKKDLIGFQPYGFTPNPKQLEAPFNEFELFGSIFRKMGNDIMANLEVNLYNVEKLKVRNSLLNITAPLYRNVLNGNVPYKGGYQAIQLAGNMQGDNPDAQYRLGQSVCLSKEDSVLMTIGLNHQSFQNCLFNTYNVTDSVKAYGYSAFLPNKVSTYVLYLIGRSKETLNYLSKQLENLFSKKYPDIDVETKICIVKTGTTQEFAIPYCHPLLNIERIYINPNYCSLSDPTKSYSLWSIFGDALNDFNTDISDDQWRSLINTTGPLINHYMEPIMFKIEKNTNNILIITLSTILGIVFLLLLSLVIFLSVRKRRQSKNA